MSDDAARTADGRLFHARGAATENDRSPRVDRLTGGTVRVDVAVVSCIIEFFLIRPDT